MKVLDLRCPQDHRFEGWFASDDEFRSQSDSGLIECPWCAHTSITRLPSAPRLNVSGAKEPQPAPTAEVAPAKDAAMQAAWLRAVAHVMNNTVDVGERFAEEARRIHYGEADERAIRGRTTPEEAQSLREEGVEVISLPVPAALKGPVQ